MVLRLLRQSRSDVEAQRLKAGTDGSSGVAHKDTLRLKTCHRSHSLGRQNDRAPTPRLHVLACYDGASSKTSGCNVRPRE